MADSPHLTGPEHYAEAERLLRNAARDLLAGRGEGNRYDHDAAVAQAQVHATLALAAATIDAERGGLEVWQQYPGPISKEAP